MATFHYEYECRTDNLCWGGLLIGRFPTRQAATRAGHLANKGCFKVSKVRVYN